MYTLSHSYRASLLFLAIPFFAHFSQADMSVLIGILMSAAATRTIQLETSSSLLP